MRTVALLAVLIAAPLVRAAAQEPAKTFEVHAEVIGYDACRSSALGLEEYVGVRLNLKNASDSVVIASRKLFGAEPKVAETMADAEKGSFIFAPEYDFVVAGKPKVPDFGDRPDAARFVILQPGQSFTTTLWWSVPGYWRARLHPGGHYIMRGLFGTWPYYTNQAEDEELQKRWSSFGRIVLEIEKTDFFKIDLPNPKHPPRCTKFRPPWDRQ